MQRSLTCADCPAVFTYEHLTGPVRKRCDACTKARKKQMDSAKSRRWREADPERAKAMQNLHNRKRLADPGYRERNRDRMVFRSYGITRPELDALIASQDGKCAICGGGPNGPGTRLHIDHCHDSKRVRGLLCAKCNTAVGLLDDDPERAEQLAAYLRR